MLDHSVPHHLFAWLLRCSSVWRFPASALGRSAWALYRDPLASSLLPRLLACVCVCVWVGSAITHRFNVPLALLGARPLQRFAALRSLTLTLALFGAQPLGQSLRSVAPMFGRSASSLQDIQDSFWRSSTSTRLLECSVASAVGLSNARLLLSSATPVPHHCSARPGSPRRCTAASALCSLEDEHPLKLRG